jgi:hypothetical protein
VTTKELRSRVEACLSSEVGLTTTERLVWLWIYMARPVGASTNKIAQDLGLELEGVGDACRSLATKGLLANITTHLGGKVWRVAGHPSRVKKVKKGATDSPDGETFSRDRKARAILARYKQRRSRAGQKPMFGVSEDKLLKWFKKIDDFLEDSGLTFDKYMDFAIKRTKRMEQMPYPTPAVLAGDWLQQEWAAAGDATPATTARESTTHAGFNYGSNDDIREELKAGGFDVSGWTKQQLWFVAGAAADIVRGKSTTVGAKYKSEVEYLVAQAKKREPE